jgi:hypothetical protein
LQLAQKKITFYGPNHACYIYEEFDYVWQHSDAHEHARYYQREQAIAYHAYILEERDLAAQQTGIQGQHDGPAADQ